MTVLQTLLLLLQTLPWPMLPLLNFKTRLLGQMQHPAPTPTRLRLFKRNTLLPRRRPWCLALLIPLRTRLGIPTPLPRPLLLTQKAGLKCLATRLRQTLASKEPQLPLILA